MPPREVKDIEELRGLIGQEVAVGDWEPVPLERVLEFAKLTGDEQWIHTDPERCARESPFGKPIVHGYLTLALIPVLSARAVKFSQPFAITINYGMNKLRFMAPVPVDSRVRIRKKAVGLLEVKGGWQVNWKVTIEIEGNDKPALIAEVLYRFLN